MALGPVARKVEVGAAVTAAGVTRHRPSLIGALVRAAVGTVRDVTATYLDEILAGHRAAAAADGGRSTPSWRRPGPARRPGASAMPWSRAADAGDSA